MKNIITEPAKLLWTPESAFREGANQDVYVTLDEETFQKGVKILAETFELVALFCVENFAEHTGFTLFYAFEKQGCPEILVIKRPLTSMQTTSVAKDFASACWYEREINDGFGVEFTDAYDKRRLFLHETYPVGFHPLLKSFPNQPIETGKSLQQEEYQFKKLEGEGVYQIPVGPVHAGIIEPGHFRFSVIGETIFNLEIRMFYKHRGVEKLAEGKKPADCLQIAESISGDESAANAAAFCIAVESIAGSHLPPRALQLRTILLEMERIYSHLGDMAGMMTDVAYPVGATGYFILREEILRLNQALTGSRFLKNIFCIGGMRRDIPSGSLDGLAEYLKAFPKKLLEANELVHKSAWVIDRLETTGIVKKELVRPLHLTGPVARASGAAADTRIAHPYGIYAQLELKNPTREKGDVMSRFELKSAEIIDSVTIINRLLGELKPGEATTPFNITDGHAMAVVEAPRGQTVHWVYVKNGVIDRYKVRTASFCNWLSLEHAVQGNIVPDFPLINKSMNLSYAGTDL